LRDVSGWGDRATQQFDRISIFGFPGCVAEAAGIRFKSIRRIGQLIELQKTAVGLAKAGRPKKIGVSETPISETPTLDQAGIDKDLAKSARKFAKFADFT
jgi:hypothetical protein